MTTTCGMRGVDPAYLPQGPAWMKLYRTCFVFLSGKRKAFLPKASKVRFATRYLICAVRVRWISHTCKTSGQTSGCVTNTLSQYQ